MTAKHVSSPTRSSAAARHASRRFADGRRVPFTDESGSTWDIGHDGRLTSWQTSATTAEWLGITTRRLQQLEKLGMPARGYRDSCRYPWPHGGIWFCMYQFELARGRRVAHLDIEEAFERHDTMNAVADVEFEYRMRRDPEYRARMLKVERENSA